MVTGTLAEHCSLVLGLLLRLEAVGSDLLVILLESSKILTSLGEIAIVLGGGILRFIQL